jgi:hypothetical protein
MDKRVKYYKEMRTNAARLFDAGFGYKRAGRSLGIPQEDCPRLAR